MKRRRTDSEAGFALIETVIAAAIVAGMMGLTYQTIAANAQASAIVRDRRAAAMVAQSVLDQATAAPDAANLTTTGRIDGLIWRVAHDPYATESRGESVPIERVTVEVRDAASNRVVLTLQTLRLTR